MTKTDHPDPDSVLTLWHGIKRAAELPAPMQDRHTPARLKRIVRDGGAHSSAVVDFLLGMDVPWVLADAWRKPAALANIRPIRMHWRPKAGESSAWGFEGLTLADLAYLVVMFERWAIPIDSSPIADAALRAIKGKRLLTDAELSLLWRKRERMDLVRFDATMPSSEFGMVETHGGYRAVCSASGLAIASPKISKRTWADELRFGAERIVDVVERGVEGAQ